MVKTIFDKFDLKTSISRFGRNSDGAVTVDWVVITAAIVVLGTIVVMATSSGQQRVAGQIDTALSSVQVN